MAFKTFSLKAKDINRNWVLFDAAETPLGRLATVIATRLSGKYKPTFTPHMDDGDFVVVINAENIIATGNKETKKIYYSYSGYPSGIKSRTLAEARQKDATKIVRAAVKGMLPKNKLSADRMARLRVFNNAVHTHDAQKPVKIGVK